MTLQDIEAFALDITYHMYNTTKEPNINGAIKPAC
jgi:hypothetical protein